MYLWKTSTIGPTRQSFAQRWQPGFTAHFHSFSMQYDFVFIFPHYTYFFHTPYKPRTTFLKGPRNFPLDILGRYFIKFDDPSGVFPPIFRWRRHLLMINIRCPLFCSDRDENVPTATRPTEPFDTFLIYRVLFSRPRLVFSAGESLRKSRPAAVDFRTTLRNMIYRSVE